ncbi:transcriptional regulator, ArsR family [Microbacterium sp. cf046]|uniref:ArsR/SmtB family transcription factor n=1 Tax=Microbacterium sp. cf046 TaxID=1761803 RepID=UPI0008E8257A|nr:metalloregulator ArsR/SmtB family transcription factor [Microbacterium sp. cf046]SFR94992.1 transcriptional regulator, ArsR family [Microbacterium sp. cf046]
MPIPMSPPGNADASPADVGSEGSSTLDKAFAALSDPVRRAIVARLSRGSSTLGELAEPFAITLQAVSKHISVLEEAGLVWRTRDAQRRPVHLDAAALQRLTAWIDGYRLQAEAAYRRLDAVVAASPVEAIPPDKEKES